MPPGPRPGRPQTRRHHSLQAILAGLHVSMERSWGLLVPRDSTPGCGFLAPGVQWDRGRELGCHQRDTGPGCALPLQESPGKGRHGSAQSLALLCARKGTISCNPQPKCLRGTALAQPLVCRSSMLRWEHLLHPGPGTGGGGRCMPCFSVGDLNALCQGHRVVR